MNRLQSNKAAPKLLIADDDPCVVRAVAERCTSLGFEVQVATSGLQALIKASQYKPDILVIDVHIPEVDGLSVCAFLLESKKQLPRVMVVTGRWGEEIAERCNDVGAHLIRKGSQFWSEFEACLAEMYPQKALAIKQSGKRAAKIEVKKCPRVLLVDDDESVKNLFLHEFEKLGAELLYAADGIQGFWKARREEPTVIVSDYRMPNGDAEYLLTRLRGAPETMNIPVIVHTARRLNQSVKQRLQWIGGQPGANRILQKSFDNSELFEALQRFCGFAGDLDGTLLYE